jgi:hypothetical protein
MRFVKKKIYNLTAQKIEKEKSYNLESYYSIFFLLLRSSIHAAKFKGLLEIIF